MILLILSLGWLNVLSQDIVAEDWCMSPEELDWKLGDCWKVNVQMLQYTELFPSGKVKYARSDGKVFYQWDMTIQVQEFDEIEQSDSLITLRFTPDSTWNILFAFAGGSWPKDLVQDGPLQVDFDVVLDPVTGETSCLKMFQLDRRTGERTQVLKDYTPEGLFCSPTPFLRHDFGEPRYINRFPMAWFPPSEWGVTAYLPNTFETCLIDSAGYTISNYSIGDTLVRELCVQHDRPAAFRDYLRMYFVKGEPWWVKYEYQLANTVSPRLRATRIRDGCE